MYYFIKLETIQEFLITLGIDFSLFTQFEQTLLFILFNIFLLLFIWFCISFVYKFLCFIFGRIK